MCRSCAFDDAIVCVRVPLMMLLCVCVCVCVCVCARVSFLASSSFVFCVSFSPRMDAGYVKLEIDGLSPPPSLLARCLATLLSPPQPSALSPQP